jgi:hypothetical protein
MKRRKHAKVGDIVTTDFGRGELLGDPNTLRCFVCDKLASKWPWPDGPAHLQHGAHGLARINGTHIVPLCKECHSARGGDAIARKLFGAPDLKVSEGGHVDSLDTVHEIAAAIVERQKKPTEH